jgi:hypothetical protein
MSIFESSCDDALGMWAATPAPQPVSAVSFSVQEQAAPSAGDIYRVNLPAQPQEAQALFDENEASFERVNAALQEIPARLDQLGRISAAGGTSFAAQGFAPESGPEGELLALLGDADRQARAEVAGALNFAAPTDPVSMAWQQVKTRFDALLTQINHDALHFAWVETNIAGLFVARTIINWNGDAQTAWVGAASPEQSLLHQRTLASVTRTRILRLRLFVTVTTGAARLTGMAVTPLGAVLALPAIYQYVTQILAQARELQSIQPT